MTAAGPAIATARASMGVEAALHGRQAAASRMLPKSATLRPEKIVGLAAFVGALVGALYGASSAGQTNALGAVVPVLGGAILLAGCLGIVALGDYVAIVLLADALRRHRRARVPVFCLACAHLAVLAWAVFVEPSGRALLCCTVVLPIELALVGALLAWADRR